VRTAGDRHVVERVGDHRRIGRRTEVHAVQQVEHHHGHGELVTGLGGQQRGVTPLGVLGDEGRLGRGDDELTASAHGLGHCSRGRGVTSLRSEHHDQVEAPRPPGQAGSGPGDERHRAHRFEHGAQQPGVGTRCDHGARVAVVEPLHRLGDGFLRPDRLPAYARTALGEVAQTDIDPGERRLVVEEPVVEGHLGPDAGLRASSTSSTGMSSRTG
jgi:hypothetical protein